MTDARNSLTLSRKIVHVFKNTLDHLNGLCLTFLKLIYLKNVLIDFIFRAVLGLQKNYLDCTEFPFVPFFISLSLIRTHAIFPMINILHKFGMFFMVNDNW